MLMFKLIMFYIYWEEVNGQMCSDGVDAFLECENEVCQADPTLNCEGIDGKFYCCASVKEGEDTEDLRPTEEIQVEDCADKVDECGDKSYVCIMSEYRRLMAKYCSVTCGFCEPEYDEKEEVVEPTKRGQEHVFEVRVPNTTTTTTTTTTTPIIFLATTTNATLVKRRRRRTRRPKPEAIPRPKIKVEDHDPPQLIIPEVEGFQPMIIEERAKGKKKVEKEARGSCVDKREDCARKSYLCVEFVYRNIMTRLCQKTCGLC